MMSLDPAALGLLARQYIMEEEGRKSIPQGMMIWWRKLFAS
jgi:hypothetical protein